MTTTPTSFERAQMIGEAAMDVLASRGGKGLTHRAVDNALGWPEGTTSRYHRTRESLMNAVVERLVAVEVVHLEMGERTTVEQCHTSHADIARILRQTYDEWTNGGVRQIARYELSLEGRRRASVHNAIVAGRRRLNDSVARLLQATGCEQAEVHSTALISLLDGLCHDRLLHPEIAVQPDGVEDIFLRWLHSC